ncbi:MAG: Zn-dependent oxidoreductase, NADPH:quinone reductase, partial [Mycobacterium sp.]|nr:Zn-dependent oxidoreductase, NADPH:quinone reductase [Mycobacterium sp.]
HAVGGIDGEVGDDHQPNAHLDQQPDAPHRRELNVDATAPGRGGLVDDLGSTEPLADDLCQRGADEATAKEEQPAEAVDEGVADEDQPGITGGQSDGKTQPEGQQQIDGKGVQPAAPQHAIDHPQPGHHRGRQQRDVFGDPGGPQTVGTLPARLLLGNSRPAEGVVTLMTKAVQFDQYGDIDVLEVRDVARPVPGDGEVLVEVKAAGLNPGEAMIRQGMLHDRWPATFPSGEGSDLAGIVVELGGGVELGSGVERLSIGDEVVGFSLTRSSHAEFTAVPVEQLTPKPAAVPWEVAGGLYTAGTAAYAAVRSVNLGAGDVVAVSGAAGGVGAIAVQLAMRSGATVLGIAGPTNDEWLAAHGVTPVNYGDELASRLRAASPTGRIDAFLDLFGGGYVELAVTQLGVSPQRVDTIIDFAAVEQFGVKVEGTADASSAAVVAELAGLVAAGELDVPIAAVYPLDQVRDAYRAVEERHSRGKVVLSMQ